MLSDINNLRPFFEDNYERINVRKYARIMKISAPFASKLLKGYEKEGLLLSEAENKYLFFVADKNNMLFIQLQRIYYLDKFRKSGLIKYLEEQLVNPVVILFGSCAKAEISDKSDIDIAIFSPSKKELNLKPYEKKLKKSIQIFIYKNREEANKNPELLNNILNGFIISGSW